jgi:hypothetical protein
MQQNSTKLNTLAQPCATPRPRLRCPAGRRVSRAATRYMATVAGHIDNVAPYMAHVVPTTQPPWCPYTYDTGEVISQCVQEHSRTEQRGY